MVYEYKKIENIQKKEDYIAVFHENRSHFIAERSQENDDLIQPKQKVEISKDIDVSNNDHDDAEQEVVKREAEYDQYFAEREEELEKEMKLRN